MGSVRTRFKHPCVWTSHAGEGPEVCRDTESHGLPRALLVGFKLGDICDGYDPQDIWNMYETGVVFRALPDRTRKGQLLYRGKAY